MISGAIYKGLPNERSKPASGLKKHANPKSDILISKQSGSYWSKRIFSGFKSLCTIFF